MKISARLWKAAEASAWTFSAGFYHGAQLDTESFWFYDSLIPNAYDFDSADERRLSLLFAAAVAEGEGL